MVRKKKQRPILKRNSIIALVITLGVVAITALLVFDTELFIQESETDVSSLSVTPEIGEPLPTEPVMKTIKCTQFDEFTELEETNSIPEDAFPCDPETGDGDIEEENELPVQIKDTKESRLQTFLEQIGFASIDQFGLATVVTNSDIANNTETFNSILPVQLLSVSTPEDFLLDKSEVEFFAILKNVNFASLNLEGTVAFIIDEEVVETKRLFTSENVLDVNNIPLNVVDEIPPPFGNRPTSFTYEYDETQFKDGSSHIFRVVITQLLGTFVADGKTFFIDWTGTFLAYELTFEIDETKEVFVNDDGEAFEILKSDSRLLVSGTPDRESIHTVKYPYSATCKKIIPAVGILEDVKVFRVDSNNMTGSLVGEVLKTDNVEVQEITGLSRSDRYIFQVGDEEFLVETPLTQIDYNVKWQTSGGKAIHRSINGGEFASGTFIGWECSQKSMWTSASSNFGFSFDSRDP